MSVRKFVVGAVSGTVAASALLVAGGMSPATAAVDPDDTTFTPVAGDLIGVGSDTSQHAVYQLANAWNAQSPAPSFKVASFAATGGGSITLPSGAVTRPNGSGAGKNLLHGGTNNTDVDFARSSSALSAGEISDGLQQIPFALDELAMAVSSSTPSYAPTSLTAQQILDIYEGTITNWSQIGGANQPIVPMIPQGGSGTRSFFLAQLKAIKGTDANLALSVTEVQEHDDSLIKNNPNAIAPFSIGRAGLLGTTLRIESGWSAKRALYNVVRQAGLLDSDLTDVFGPDGFVCSPGARSLIRDAGFKQLASEADGGVCGVATQDPTTNFATSVGNPDDTDFTPVAGDLIGVGSDTSQNAVLRLADAWNAQSPAPSFKVASFAATGGGSITLPSGAVTRPNGSGAGKNLLHGGTNNTDVDFARSSSALSAGEISDGLQQIPFALDELAMAVSSSTPSYAPTSLTAQQILDIYEGTITNWSQIGGANQPIVPMIPQGGSGTRSFFLAQLKAIKGTDANLALSVTEVQEHDDSLIKNNPNAIAPFSIGRAGLLGTTLRIESGWSAKRALYNVVRQAGLLDSDLTDVFGPDGFVCSDGATGLISAAGFQQLASEADGGVCGVATQDPTTNFALNGSLVPDATTLTATATSPSARKVVLRGVVAPSGAAGTVTFKDGAAVVAADVPVVSGVATRTLTSVTPGAHSYTATFTPTDADAFEASADTTPYKVTVRTTATIAESFRAAVARGSRARGTITVALVGTTTKATGKVQVKLGTKVLATGTLRSGRVTLTLPKLARGRKTLTIVWAGNALAPKTSRKFIITQR